MENKTITSTDIEGKEVKVVLKSPSEADYRDSQIAYNKAFREALDSGAPLRQKLSDIMVEQNIWSDAKQAQHDSLVDQIQGLEKVLTSGGIKLSDAKGHALKLRELRDEFRVLVTEKNILDQNSVEGQADNARFAELVRLCMINPATRKPFFSTQEEYDLAGMQPWVSEASAELASMLYGLDPDYDSKLVENEFLVDYGFADKELRLINEDGHLIDSEGRLIDEDGRFVAYKTKKAAKEQDVSKRYFVNIDGKEVVETENGWEVKGEEIVKKPFLMDDGSEASKIKKPEEGQDKDS